MLWLACSMNWGALQSSGWCQLWLLWTGQWAIAVHLVWVDGDRGLVIATQRRGTLSIEWSPLTSCTFTKPLVIHRTMKLEIVVWNEQREVLASGMFLQVFIQRIVFSKTVWTVVHKYTCMYVVIILTLGLLWLTCSCPTLCLILQQIIQLF